MTPRPNPAPVSAEEREAAWQWLVRYLETKRRQLDQQLPHEVIFDDRFRTVLALLTGDDAA